MEEKKLKSGATSKTASVIALIVCIFFAFVMWVYVMMVESPEYETVIQNLTVELEGTEGLSENKLAVYSGYGNMIDITVSGKRSIVSKLTEDDIGVYADISTKNTSGRYNADVMVDLPQGVKLVSKSADTISVYLDEAAEKMLELTEKRENSSLPEDCFTGEVDLTVDYVTVTGPQLVLNKIASAVLTLDMTDVTKTTTVKGTVSLVDESGNPVDSKNISYSPREITVNIPVYKTVKVPLEVEFKQGFLSYDNTTVTIEPSVIEVTGDVDTVSKGSLVDTIVVDEKTSFENGRFNRVVTLEGADGVELSSDKAEVTITLNPTYSTKSFVVPGERINPVNVQEDVNISWPKSDVEVILLGRSDVLATISDDDISVVFDMAPFSSSNAGTIRIKADIEIESVDSESVLPVGSYFVNVKFLEAKDTDEGPDEP